MCSRSYFSLAKKLYCKQTADGLLFFQLIEVFHQDQFIGRVRERPICIGQERHLEVFNDSDEKIYDINGPCCYNPCVRVAFDVSN